VGEVLAFRLPNFITLKRSKNSRRSWRRKRSGAAGFAFASGRHGEGARHDLDVLDAAKAQGGPVFINGDLTDGLEAGFAHFFPTVIAIEVGFVLPGSAFGIGDPDGGVARGGLCNAGGKGVDLLAGERELEHPGEVFRAGEAGA